MGANLIKSILQMEGLVEIEISSILFLLERFKLFGPEILTPASRMVAVARF